jgi:hypothetical protein
MSDASSGDYEGDTLGRRMACSVRRLSLSAPVGASGHAGGMMREG